MVKVKITKHVEVKKTQPEAQPQAQEGQGVCEGEGDIVFANSKKSKLFECEEMKGKCVDAVGGTNGALGPRLEKAGICNANDLTCKMRGMTKRKYLRYIMKVSDSIIHYHNEHRDTFRK